MNEFYRNLEWPYAKLLSARSCGPCTARLQSCSETKLILRILSIDT